MTNLDSDPNVLKPIGMAQKQMWSFLMGINPRDDGGQPGLIQFLNEFEEAFTACYPIISILIFRFEPTAWITSNTPGVSARERATVRHAGTGAWKSEHNPICFDIKKEKKDSQWFVCLDWVHYQLSIKWRRQHPGPLYTEKQIVLSITRAGRQKGKATKKSHLKHPLVCS